MFIWSITNGRAVEEVGSRSIKTAWGMIADAIWKRCYPNETQIPGGHTGAEGERDNQAEDESDSQNDNRGESNNAADMEDARRQDMCQDSSN